MRIDPDPRLQADRLVPRLTDLLKAIGQQVNGLSEGRISARHQAATAAPTTGTYAQGDFVTNSAPSGAAPVIGWVCTVGGTPGTWVAVSVGGGGGGGGIATVKEEGTTVGSSFTSINFVGASVTATDAGGGQANVTVTAGGTAGTHSIPIMASGMAPSASGGCAALAVLASAANQPDIVALAFDAATEEYAQFSIPMPGRWNEGTITARFLWSHAATATNFGVVWGIQAVALSDDDAIAVAYGAAQTVTDTGGTTNDIYRSAATSAMTVAGSPAAEDLVMFRVYRKSADAADTMTIDARLHAVVLYITTDAENDA